MNDHRPSPPPELATELFPYATVFLIARDGDRLGPDQPPCPINLEIKWRGKRAGTNTWVVAQDDEVLGVESRCWEPEPQPSSRSDDFIARTRFTSLEAAYRAAIDERDLAIGLGNPGYHQRKDDMARLNRTP